MDYTKINSETIDKWSEEGWQWGKPITHEIFLEAKNGKWNMLLTPTKYVPKEWYPDLKDKNVLGLASGGGQQMPIFAALGSICTLMDYSQKQIDSDLLVSKRENYNINLVKADMTKTFPFDDKSFDIIFHPVSNCYIEDVMHVWKECYRVLKNGGVLMSGLDNGINYLFDENSENEKEIKYKLPFNPLKDEALLNKLIQNNDMLQNGNKNENNNGNEDNSDNSNVKYGYAISGVDPITQREFTNEATSINQVINNSNEFIKNELTKSILDEALNIFVKNYADNVKNMRDSQLEYSIEEFNTKLNTDKTLTGNIKIKFTFIGSVTSAVSNQNRESGDVEIHNFVFENSKIESYVNTVTSNFVSFKITTKHLQKQFIFKNQDNYKKNINVGILNEIIYLDSFNKFTLQLNNSPFTLNYNNFLENNYLYNFSNKDEKEAFKEIISTITRGKGKLKVFGKDPSRPNLNLSSPVYYITLSKQYNLSTSFASNIT